MRAIKGIVIHCSASPNSLTLFNGSAGKPNFKTPAMEINEWHRARGFHRTAEWRNRQNPDLDAIGYHFVIARNGAIFTCRHIDEIGAHVQGKNQYTLGVCLVGMDSFTLPQWDALKANVSSLAKLAASRGNQVRIVGHRDLSPDANKNGKVEKFEWLKTCPNFSVADWLDGGMVPLAGQISEA